MGFYVTLNIGNYILNLENMKAYVFSYLMIINAGYKCVVSFFLLHLYGLGPATQAVRLILHTSV